MDDQTVLELTTGENGRPELSTKSVEFHRGYNTMNTLGPGVSSPETCKSIVYVELPVGFDRNSRIADRDQIAVCLTGKLKISAADGKKKLLGPGDVFRIPAADTSEHGLSVVGEAPVRLVVINQ